MTTIPVQPIPEPVPAEAPASFKKGVTLRNFSMVIALVAIWVFFAANDRSFLGARNLSNLAVELSITAVLSLGMLLILLLGHVDLSIGSGVGLFGGIAAVLIFQHNWPAPAAMAVAAGIALVVWLAMGSLIVVERIPAFIITLAGMLVFRGLHWLTIGSQTVYVQVGGATNLVSLLTTWFLPRVAGYVLVAAVWAVIAWTTMRQRQRRLSFGLSVDARDIMISKLILWAQGLLLFVLVCNQYRGIPLAATEKVFVESRCQVYVAVVKAQPSQVAWDVILVRQAQTPEDPEVAVGWTVRRVVMTVVICGA